MCANPTLRVDPPATPAQLSSSHHDSPRRTATAQMTPGLGDAIFWIAVACCAVAQAALLLAFAQIVFGAIVRITGSGWGCGEHWPTCNGRWVPPMNRPDLVIEVMHRYIAAALVLTAVVIAVVAYLRRREPGVGGPGGVQ